MNTIFCVIFDLLDNAPILIKGYLRIFKICLEQFLTSSQNLHFLVANAGFSSVSGWRKAQLAYIVAIETYPF